MRNDIDYNDVRVLEYGSVRVSTDRAKISVFPKAKRTFDVLFALTFLILLSPLFLLIALAINIDSSGPVFFGQKRVGKNCKAFKMYKFRSMCIDAEDKLKELQHLNERSGPVFKISKDPRVTRVGKLLRKTCLDELPQLINILIGDMSLVGPRPPLPNEVEKYNVHHMKRLAVKPGLTCTWQISNRKCDFDGWVDMDIEYIKNRCVKNEIKIILKTFLVVFKLKGDS